MLVPRTKLVNTKKCVSCCRIRFHNGARMTWGCEMANTVSEDKSNGYEQIAEIFIQVRNPRIGAAVVREWSRTLPPAASVLDLGCGHGVPISQVLIQEGFAVYAIDASAKLISAFRHRFSTAHAECSAVENSKFFRRTSDGIVAWG
jgi:2-polyprenyl-3-methyl-5-hydroxy-6-metoxy-1,4-benzoquinol methylase